MVHPCSLHANQALPQRQDTEKGNEKMKQVCDVASLQVILGNFYSSLPLPFSLCGLQQGMESQLDFVSSLHLITISAGENYFQIPSQVRKSLIIYTWKKQLSVKYKIIYFSTQSPLMSWTIHPVPFFQEILQEEIQGTIGC